MFRVQRKIEQTEIKYRIWATTCYLCRRKNKSNEATKHSCLNVWLQELKAKHV